MLRVVLLMCATFLAGCAQLSDLMLNKSTRVAEGQTVGSVSFSQLLAHEPTNTLVTLSNSPWGASVQVLLHETYAAASGRNCRRLTVDPEGQSYPALACQHPKKDQDWVPVRLLQIGGRPVLNQSTSLPAWNERR